VATDEQKVEWETAIAMAEEKRTKNPAAMDVMAPHIPKGWLILSVSDQTYDPPI
jgi:hypothetical protein